MGGERKTAPHLSEPLQQPRTPLALTGAPAGPEGRSVERLLWRRLTLLPLDMRLRCSPLGSPRAQSLSHFGLFATPWTEAHQVPRPWSFPARIPEWVVTSSSRGSSRPRDRTCVCLCLLHGQDSLPRALWGAQLGSPWSCSNVRQSDSVDPKARDSRRNKEEAVS